MLPGLADIRGTENRPLPIATDGIENNKLKRTKNWEEREVFLKTLPKNAENLRKILEAMDDGKFDEWNDKQK